MTQTTLGSQPLTENAHGRQPLTETENARGRQPQRVIALDAYRGFVMMALASAGFGIVKVAGDFPGSPLWQALEHQCEHVTWRGCAFWDLIQPSFMFIVGVAMPYSYASRRARGDSWWQLFRHALGRSLILIALGVFLSSAGSKQTNYSFVNVLTQIGLGYMFVFLVLGRPAWVQLTTALAILSGYWLLFAMHPVRPNWIDPSELGIPDNWQYLPGFFAHWDKNANFASHFDRWFLNLFPRPSGARFRYNEGGYATLNFIPSIATMIFGVMAGGLLRGRRTPLAKLQTLAIVGAVCVALGTMLDGTICPVVKRIWTPSWTISSAGWACWMLAIFYGAIDVAGYRRWAFPFVVVGANSIAIYVMSQLLRPFIANSLKIHFGVAWEALATAPAVDRFVSERTGMHLTPRLFGGVYGPIVQATAVLLVLWLICFWMYRRRIFVKI